MNNSMSVNSHDSMRKSRHKPVLPPLLAIPIASVPEKYSAQLVVRSLNLMLEESLKEGELDFLDGHSVSLTITDCKLKFGLTLESEKLVTSSWQANDDLNISGDLYDFMLLASRQEDSDTMFFHRRLKMEGSTDLGLEVKNLLDGMDMETVPFHRQLDFALKHGIKIFEKLFS